MNEDFDTVSQTNQSKFDRLEEKIDKIILRLPRPPSDDGPINLIARLIENSSVTRLLAAAGVWLFVFTLLGIVWEVRTRSEERVARQEEAEFRKLAQIATAWEVLLRPIGGDIGKGNALNTLISAKQIVRDADFSCEAAGTYIDGKCKNRPQFNNLFLGTEPFWEPDDHGDIGLFEGYVLDTNFSETEIHRLRAEYLEISNAFNFVKGSNWQVRNAYQYHFQTESSNLIEFACRSCTFYTSHLSFDFFRSLTIPTLIDVKIYIPKSNRTDALDILKNWNTPRLNSSNEFSPRTQATTTLGNPVTFEFSEGPQGDGAGMSFLDVTPSSSLLLPLYHDLDFCVTKTDYQSLLPHLLEIDSSKLQKAEAFAVEQEGSESGVEFEMIVPSQRKWASTYATKLWVLPRTSTDWQRFGPVEELHECGYSYLEVEPLLLTRI